MRRLSDRARLEGMLALRKALEGVRRGQAAARTATDGIGHAALRERRIEDSSWSRRTEFGSDDEPDAAGDPYIAPLVGRRPRVDEVARIASPIPSNASRAQLDSYHLERAEHLDAIEFLLREMVISSVPVSGSRSIVLGGVVEPGESTAKTTTSRSFPTATRWWSTPRSKCVRASTIAGSPGSTSRRRSTRPAGAATGSRAAPTASRCRSCSTRATSAPCRAPTTARTRRRRVHP